MGLIIGISGKARSGKDTFGGLLKALSTKYGVEVELRSFASKLKDIARRDFGLTDEQLNGLEKETHLERWNSTPRTILQKLGKGYRDIHENYWVDVVFDSLEVNSGKILVVTDCRFLNEYKGIRDRNGLVVRMERDGELRGVVSNPWHPSETELDNASFDLIVQNNSTIESLKKTAEFFLLNILENTSFSEK